MAALQAKLKQKLERRNIATWGLATSNAILGQLGDVMTDYSV